MKKTILTALFAMALLSISACGSTESSESATDNNEPASAETTVVEETTKSEWFIAEYNKVASNPITDVTAINVLDKEAGHYRTEFRLTAYKDAVGKSYLLGNKVVDIIASQTIYGEINCRVYTNDTSLDQVVALLQGFSPILDAELTAGELQETITEVSTKKIANGYYFGKLGITLFGSDEKGYELMLKNG